MQTSADFGHTLRAGSIPCPLNSVQNTNHGSVIGAGSNNLASDPCKLVQPDHPQWQRMPRLYLQYNIKAGAL